VYWGSRWRRGVNFPSQPLYPRHQILIHIELEAAWATDVVWTGWRREESLASAWIRTLDCFACRKSLCQQPYKSLISAILEEVRMHGDTEHEFCIAIKKSVKEKLKKIM
jgi:hypothetical protein